MSVTLTSGKLNKYHSPLMIIVVISALKGNQVFYSNWTLFPHVYMFLSVFQKLIITIILPVRDKKQSLLVDEHWQ